MSLDSIPRAARASFYEAEGDDDKYDESSSDSEPIGQRPVSFTCHSYPN